MRVRQNGCYSPDDIFKCILLNENVWISIKISLKFVPNGPNNNILALVQIMAWHRPGDKPLCELMTPSLQTHICITRPEKVNPLKCLPPGVLLRLVSSQNKFSGYLIFVEANKLLLRCCLCYKSNDNSASAMRGCHPILRTQNNSDQREGIVILASSVCKYQDCTML